jgi:hypothetical protein
MITYSQSFKSEAEANRFLDTLLHRDQFVISKVANDGGDIYFIEPEPILTDEEITALHLKCWDEIEFARAIEVKLKGQ